ncbi:mevalonate diphosphate decarboxylase [Haematobia irritans]|uniref:mevalonate diphosphate decarboxylase n=1 Tax=Haematobia irritans TaxID=7368 RepID=UPI003F4F48A3
MFIETCIAPVNIALIKYWGKRDEELILPINDSLSMTLSTDEMCAKTTASACATYKEHRMWLNGEEVPFEDNPRIMRCLKALQRLALAKCQTLKFPLEWKLHIVSRNNFPTAAGLASSAAGYACLVYTLASLYGVQDEELTAIARQGSGSACRSLHGGFVRWHKGEASDGSDSIALPVVTSNHWPNMHVLILVVNDARKKTSSTKGMQRAVETSDLIKYRAKQCVPERIEAITEAIKQRDFERFAKITMQDSNQFHAIALDTYPPCVYMNDVSHAIATFVHAYNMSVGKTRVAYTFDAGPNACLYVLKEHVSSVLKGIETSFPNDAGSSVEYIKGIPIDEEASPSSSPTDTILNGNFVLPTNERNLLKYIIHTKVGSGPQRLAKTDSLLNSSTGLPF